jgi:predicted methyltransferase
VQDKIDTIKHQQEKPWGGLGTDDMSIKQWTAVSEILKNKQKIVLADILTISYWAFEEYRMVEERFRW